MSAGALDSGALDSGHRLRWAFADGLTIVGRNLGHLRRAPGQLVAALIFPAIMILLFGYVFGSAISVPGGGNYREYLMPGMFAMVSFTSVLVTMTVTASDIGRGVMDRFRSMPMARSAVPFGQTGADIITGVVGLVIMAGCGAVVGWRAHNGVWSTLAGFGLLILLRYAVSWIGIFLGLVVKNEETADQFTPLVFPVTMISDAYVPTAGMPGWLQTVADWNPVSAVTQACRQLFGNPGVVKNGALPMQHPVITTLIWVVALLAVFVPLSVRRYARAND